MLKHETELTAEGLKFKAVAPAEYAIEGQTIEYEVRVADLINGGDSLGLLLFAIFMKLAQAEERNDAMRTELRARPSTTPSVASLIAQLRESGLFPKAKE